MSRAIQAMTEDPLFRLVMEIIAHDSTMHRPVRRYLPAYLLEDGWKHDLLLERREEIKNRTYPCA